MQQSILELVDLNKGCQMGHKIQPIYKILVLLFLYKLRWKHTVLPFIEKITALMKVRCHFCGRIITSLAYTLHANKIGRDNYLHVNACSSDCVHGLKVMQYETYFYEGNMYMTLYLSKLQM